MYSAPAGPNSSTVLRNAVSGQVPPPGGAYLQQLRDLDCVGRERSARQSIDDAGHVPASSQ